MYWNIQLDFFLVNSEKFQPPLYSKNCLKLFFDFLLVEKAIWHEQWLLLILLFSVQVDSISKHSSEIKVRMNAIHNCHNPFSKCSLAVTAANGSLHSLNFSLLFLIFVPLTLYSPLKSKANQTLRKGPWPLCGWPVDVEETGQWVFESNPHRTLLDM